MKAVLLRRMLYRIFMKSVVFLLFLTASSKLMMAFGSSRILDQSSPLFEFLVYRQLLFFSAGLEITVAILILSSWKRIHLAATAIACLASAFLAYKLLLWLKGFDGYCECLGSLSDALHLSMEQANGVADGILAYFFIGSYGLLIYTWRVKQSKKVKYSTPAKPL